MHELWFTVGPTASGKTAVALQLALMLPVEIVSLDSMTVYRDMDIGTAKPSPRERRAVPHHLIDVVDPNESFSVGRYREEAGHAVARIVARGKRPLFVGGTPLYLKAMTHGLFDGPPADTELRRTLHERARRQGPEVLHRRLSEVDPAAARRIHPNDLKRVVRALEVHENTGRPISAHQTEWTDPKDVPDCVIVGISRDRDELYRRIDARVDRMFADGLIEEVRRLLSKYGRLGRQAAQALGYREVLGHLAGETDIGTTIDLVKRNTRRMAKRQLTWFRSFDKIHWFAMDEGTPPVEVARAMVETFKGRETTGGANA